MGPEAAFASCLLSCFYMPHVSEDFHSGVAAVPVARRVYIQVSISAESLLSPRTRSWQSGVRLIADGQLVVLSQGELMIKRPAPSTRVMRGTYKGTHREGWAEKDNGLHITKVVCWPLTLFVVAALSTAGRCGRRPAESRRAGQAPNLDGRANQRGYSNTSACHQKRSGRAQDPSKLE